MGKDSIADTMNQLSPDEIVEIDMSLEYSVKVAEANEQFDQEIERMLAGLSLPLNTALAVSDQEVPAKSQTILEEIVRLKQERDAAIKQAYQRIGAYVHGFAEEQREEVYSRIKMLVEIA